MARRAPRNRAFHRRPEVPILPRVRRRQWLPAVAIAAAAGVALSGCDSSPSAPSATRLHVTAAVTAALLRAGAMGHGLPVSDFTGLQPGLTYYAWDRQDHLYWAGAALVPSRHSMRAQVSVQDDGGYNLFTMPKGGAWTSFPDGLGTVPGTRCAVAAPAAVRKVWGWSLHTPCGGPPAPAAAH